MVQRVGAVGPHDVLIVREIGRIQRVADVDRGRDQREQPRSAELERWDRHAEAQERRREDETGQGVGRPVLDVGGGDESAEAVAEEIQRPPRLLLADGLQEDGRVVEVVGEALQVTAPAGNKIKGKDRGVARKRALSARALADLDAWLASPARAAAE